MEYKSQEDTPRKLDISTYWSDGSGMSYLREGLGINHPENLYNWFKKTYPEYNPLYFKIKNPKSEEFDRYSREQLIDEIISLREIAQQVY